MSTSTPSLQLEFHADRQITRWRPLVQWLLAIPHLMIAYALRSVRQVLTLISLFTVLFTERIPLPLFELIVMTYRYEWRAMSYALFMHEDYPPFDFTLSTEDDGMEPHTSLRLTYPERLDPLEAAVQVVPGHPPVLRAGRPLHRGVLGHSRRLPRRPHNRQVSGRHPGPPGQLLPLRAPGRGVRRLPHRSLPALPPRSLRQLPARCS